MLDDFGLPCFIDVESSGFGPESYPISIAWSSPSGEIQRCLIKVSAIPEWTYWSEKSEAIHGIDRDRLERNGWDPAYVLARLAEDLGGLKVFSDAPDFDRPWLVRLAVALDSDLPFDVEHVEDLLIPLLRQPHDMVYEAALRLEKIKQELSPQMSGRHDAGYDVGYLIQLWRRAQGLESKMNHGRGPLPDTTETGTFRRSKL